jgi:hypothetical protein
MVARLLREKGVYEFVEAARLVKQRVPAACFQLLGRRDERNPTVVPQRELAAWEAEGVVTWLGEVPDVRPFVSRADVVVLPSYREGTPRSLLEAAAMEKPHSHLRGAIIPTPRQQGMVDDAPDAGSPRWSWARLLTRVFALAMARCPFCTRKSLLNVPRRLPRPCRLAKSACSLPTPPPA